MSKPALTVDRLREVLHYDPATGIFTWRIDRSNKRAGDVAGCFSKKHKCIQIRIDRVLLYAHRLAWLYMTGEWPACLVDHRDTVPSNNAWENLREATKPQNEANSGARKHNRSGLKGAGLTRSGRYSAKIRVGKRRENLGTFDTAEEAHRAYMARAEEIYGEFARAE